MKAWVITALFVHGVFALAWVFAWSDATVVLCLMGGIGVIMLLWPAKKSTEGKPQNTRNTQI